MLTRIAGTYFAYVYLPFPFCFPLSYSTFYCRWYHVNATHTLGRPYVTDITVWISSKQHSHIYDIYHVYSNVSHIDAHGRIERYWRSIPKTRRRLQGVFLQMNTHVNLSRISRRHKGWKGDKYRALPLGDYVNRSLPSSSQMIMFLSRLRSQVPSYLVCWWFFTWTESAVSCHSR